MRWSTPKTLPECASVWWTTAGHAGVRIQLRALRGADSHRVTEPGWRVVGHRVLKFCRPLGRTVLCDSLRQPPGQKTQFYISELESLQPSTAWALVCWFSGLPSSWFCYALCDASPRCCLLIRFVFSLLFPFELLLPPYVRHFMFYLLHDCCAVCF